MAHTVILVALVLLAVAPAPASAAVLTWNGSASTNWGTAANWTPSQVPATGDDLVLTLGGDNTPSNNDLPGAVQLRSVTLSDTPGETYAIGGNPIVLQSGGFITSNRTAGLLPDTILAGVSLNGPATITHAGTRPLNFSGSITGTGGLTLVNNSGAHDRLNLNAANTYTGATTISGTHRIVANVNGAIPTSSAVSIVSGGLAITANSTIGSLSGVGVVTVTGTTGVAVLRTGNDNTSTTYSGVLQNGPQPLGLTKVGTGTFTLAGTNTYTSNTAVNAGTLLVNTSLAAASPVAVGNGGTLGGIGTVGGNVTVLPVGRLAPGASIGTLTVAGAGGVLWHGAPNGLATALFELSNSDTTSDRLAIAGPLTKGNGPLFLFDFQGTGQEGVYTLATFGSTTFSAADFSYTNLTPGLVGTFAIVGNTLRFTATEGPPPTHDFNGDFTADILWRDTAGGQVVVWLIDGLSVIGTSLVANLAPTWTAEGVGDFNGDGDADILWRDVSGGVAVWLLNGTAVATFGPVIPVPTTWTIAGVGDFNADGNTDILWRESDGTVAIWLMNGTTPLVTALVTDVPTAWVVAGVGDFDGDGLADILWRETTTGLLAVWFMNGTTIAGSTTIATVGTEWEVAGVGDFNGDGTSDILWRADAGTVALWLMNGTTPGTTSIASSHILATIPNVWTIAAVLDFDGDAHADILWRHDDGTAAIWLMNGATNVGSGVIGSLPASWVPQ